MAAAPLDIEFSKYWSQLTLVQKESLLKVIKSFVQPETNTGIDQYNQELAEAEADFDKGDYISQEEMLKLISQW